MSQNFKQSFRRKEVTLLTQLTQNSTQYSTCCIQYLRDIYDFKAAFIILGFRQMITTTHTHTILGQEHGGVYNLILKLYKLIKTDYM